jgi:hypothetical protein
LKGASSPPASTTVVTEAVDHSGRGWAASAVYVALPRMPVKSHDAAHPSAALTRAGGKFIPRVSPLTLAVQVRSYFPVMFSDCLQLSGTFSSEFNAGAASRCICGPLEVRSRSDDPRWLWDFPV